MPCDGPLILTDVRGPILVILCEARERRAARALQRRGSWRSMGTRG